MPGPDGAVPFGREGVAPKGGWTVGWTVAFSGGPEVLPEVWTPLIGHRPFLQVTPCGQAGPARGHLFPTR